MEEKMINKEDRNRILKLLVAVLFILSFFLVNARQYAFAFLIYIVMGILSVLFYLVWDKISKKSDLEGLGKHWIRNSFIGLGLAVVTMVAGTIIPGLGVIGTPSLSQSVVQLIGVLGSFMVIVVSASLFEGIFIINALTDFFENFLGLNKHFAISLMAVVGSFFHLTSYGLVASDRK